MTVVQQAPSVRPEPWALGGNRLARVLHRRSTGEWAVEIDLDGAESVLSLDTRNHTFEVFVVSGSLGVEVAGESVAVLSEWGYLHAPAGVRLRLIGSSQTRILVFADPPRPSDTGPCLLVNTEPNDWRAGTVSARDTGRALALEVRDLYQVPQTGQRTWLLRAGADLVLPFERHRTIEEGYIVRGHYRLIERLTEGPRRFDHGPGGYFWRPPGIVHGGPDSGSDGDFMMLLRTPESLTVEFVS